jgi:chemotaxis protein MotD
MSDALSAAPNGQHASPLPTLRDAMSTAGAGTGQRQALAALLPTKPGAGFPSTGNGDTGHDLPHAQTQPVATVSVVAQETHAVPVMRLTPVQQIADSIVSAAGGAQSAKLAGPVAPLAPPPGQAKLQPLQVLNVTLDPPGLGAVSVKMRLTGAKLDLQIEVSQKEIVPLLDKEGDSLSSSLQSSGYTIDNLTIKAAENNGFSAQHRHDPSHGEASGQQSAFQSPSHSAQSGSPQSGGGRPDDRAPANTDGSAPQSNRNDVIDDAAVKNSLSGDLYI